MAVRTTSATKKTVGRTAAATRSGKKRKVPVAFLINMDGVFYVTQGRLLEYDRTKANGNSPGDQRKREAIGAVETLFYEEKRKPRTFYEAVTITDNPGFGMHTNQ